jgi:L-ascorbate metabolism protein UlaG (beta-lactamase superfamily)
MRRLIVLVLLFMGRAQALEIKFLGVSSMLLSDGEDQILFDAPFTRPGPLHWINLESFESDPELVKKVLDLHQINKLRAIFVSHHHVDHVIDVPQVAKLTGAKAYGDVNLKTIMLKNGPIGSYQEMREEEQIKIGAFSILPIPIDHGSLPLEFLFNGKVPQDFDNSLYDYQEGGTWFYLITHGKKRIIWNGSTGDALAVLRKRKINFSPAQLYVLGMGGKSLKEQIAKLDGDHPFEQFIPVHFDNFFLSYDEKEFNLMPFSNINKEIKEVKKTYPSRNWILPELGKTYQL